jgi:hypothetical protein
MCAGEETTAQKQIDAIQKAQPPRMLVQTGAYKDPEHDFSVMRIARVNCCCRARLDRLVGGHSLVCTPVTVQV